MTMTTDRDITHLSPEMLSLYQQWLAECADAGLSVKLITSWRDPADQDAAKAEGLSNAGAGQSPHNCCDADGNPASKAFDFGVFDEDGNYVTDGKDDRYTQAGAIGEELGLVWGGSWHHPDFDHLELANWKA